MALVDKKYMLERLPSCGTCLLLRFARYEMLNATVRTPESLGCAAEICYGRKGAKYWEIITFYNFS